MLELLGDNDPILVLEATPKLLEAFLLQLSGEALEQSYGPGKWSARYIFAHLTDVELAVGFRNRQLVAGVETLQTFDQDVWARSYRRLEPSLALESFRASRAWNLAFLATLDMDDWLREAYHPERGPLSVDLSVRMSAGHDLNHLAQLQQIAGV